MYIHSPMLSLVCDLSSQDAHLLPPHFLPSLLTSLHESLFPESNIKNCTYKIYIIYLAYINSDFPEPSNALLNST